MLMRRPQDPALDLTRIYEKRINEQNEYTEPADPWHYTMNYTTETDEIYDEAFIDELEVEKEELIVGDIYLGREGVVAAVEELTEKNGIP
ncbi:hypothetical protein NHX12_001193 [Muraenolepis orangiensis]|uniref:Uncharacterized protein n=1 Tax=Muraenolepis orangiensis TaxID=630683 RepID=A0A9Q0E1M0_9TELE|nr:hypothetical protein NHX12_001193 [Muraenolepis orangiensis]